MPDKKQMTATDVKIRKQVKGIMKASGLTQGELARRLGITPQSLGDIFQGRRGLIPPSLLAVLEELDLELTLTPKIKT